MSALAHNPHLTQLSDHFADNARGNSLLIDVQNHNYEPIANGLIAALTECPEPDLEASQWSPNPFLFTFLSSRLGPNDFLKPVAERWGYLVGQTNAVYGYGGGDSGAMGAAAEAFVESRTQINPQAFTGSKIQLLGVVTPKFHGDEIDVEGALTIKVDSRNFHAISNRKDIIADTLKGVSAKSQQPNSALIALPGGQGTDDENEHVLSRYGYEDKFYPPLVLVNSTIPEDSPGYNPQYPGFYDLWLAHKRQQQALGLTSENFMQAVRSAPSPDDVMAYLLDKLPNLKWLGSNDEKPVLTPENLEPLIRPEPSPTE